tara:strand:- start:948 stop:1673 length:726 start_codon:yes stop_codon:yes gene_type:complete
MKGFIHAHSRYSHDSLNPIDLIINKAIEHQLDFIILTDHENIRGSLELRKRVKERNLNLIVPIAAEYKTEYGDIIAAFIKNEIVDMSFDNFVNEVKSQGGLLMLPHPYQSHPIDKLEYISSKMDSIEIFNSRCTKEQDLKAEVLAHNAEKPYYYGSDAHLNGELCNVIISLEVKDYNEASLKEALQKSEVTLIEKDKVYLRSIRISQLIKSFKRRRFSIFYSNIIGLIINNIRLGWNKKIE